LEEKHNHIKNQTSIFLKVLLGFGIMSGLLLTAYYFTNENLSSLKDNLKILGLPNPKQELRMDVIRKIDETESIVKKYTVNKDSFLLVEFDSTVKEIGSTMDQLAHLSSDNVMYYDNLMKLGLFINNKINVEDQLIGLAGAYDSGSEFADITSEISKETKTNSVPKPDSIRQLEKSDNFFQRFFSARGLRVKQKDQSSDYQPPVSIPAVKLKEIIRKAEKSETEKTAVYLNEMLLLMNKDDQIQDSIRSVASQLEKLEVTESLKLANKLSDETTDKTGNILSTIILSGILIMILFLIIVYFEVRKGELLKQALIKEKQNTEKLAKVKEEFLANMSHEIRTPMNVIAGFSDQLLKTDLSNDQQKLLLNIKRSSNHLINVINEILDYSKMESGNISFETIPFNIKEIINDVYESFKTSAQNKGIKLNYEIDEAVAKKLSGDPVRLKQILLNLTGNAIKFTEKGTVEIICKLWEGNNEFQTVLFEVKDSGIGIAPEATDRIFDQFTQADASVTRKYGGTGLGLAITKKYVELQGGEIGVRSELEKGSTFYFRIGYPIVSEENKEKVQALSLEKLNLQILSGKRILIVDDDEMNKALATYILENYDVDIDSADNGKDALEKIKEENYDLILMDLHMPEMSGIEVVSQIRKRNIDTPVIAITGNVLKTEKEKCMSAGMNEFISKPYDESELLQKIINLLLTI
jgi:signal transduction histidine kinase